MDLRLKTPVTEQAKRDLVGLEKFKLHAKIRDGSEDDLLKDYLVAAYDFLSGYDGWLNGYCLLAETYELYLPTFGDTVEMPLRPVDPDSIKIYIRDAGVLYPEVLAGSFVAARTKGMTAVGVLDRDAFLRTGYAATPLAYKVEFVAGHASKDVVPSPLKQSILMLAADFYMHREDSKEITGSSQKINQRVENGLNKLAGRYRFSPDHS